MRTYWAILTGVINKGPLERGSKVKAPKNVIVLPDSEEGSMPANAAFTARMFISLDTSA